MADKKPESEPQTQTQSQSQPELKPIVRMSCTYYKVIEKHNRLF